MSKRCHSIEKRRRRGGEIATPRVAIRNFCLECCGYMQSEVTECTSPACWLYPWRHGLTPERAAGEKRQIDFSPADPAIDGDSRPRLRPKGRRTQEHAT